ncbi:MAG: DHHA1 domain-containing protein [Acidobacteriota bacterium]
MQPTTRLYYSDSALLDFQATVLEVQTVNGQTRIVLDQTAFYPTGGGQPFDTGRLSGIEIIEVIEENDKIFHITNASEQLSVGQIVECHIDAARRLEHLQQHSGQHLLSQAFIQAVNAETRSFHLGSQSSTIDIELATPNDEAMRAAEEIANAIVFENRPMRVHLVNDEEATQLPLRKESAVSGIIRVIEIEDFDWSPCGGTHAKQTGQIGLIVIKSFERVKSNLTRVEFVCGHRALEDYRLANQTAVTTARLFSVGRDGAPPLVEKNLQEVKTLKRRIKDLLELAMTTEALQLINATPETNGLKLIKLLFDNRDVDELRILVSKLTTEDSVVALLATKDDNGARLIFARSMNLSQNMGQLLSAVCQMTGGRGGGKPEMAQGGATDVSKLAAALNDAAEQVLR